MATETTVDELALWRADQFEAMGFNPHQAAALAVARDDETGFLLDSHKIEDMMANGCTPEQAIAILL